MKQRRRKGEDNPLVCCECGCGTMFEKFDECGRPRRFTVEHRHLLPLRDQFEKFVVKKDGCWGWSGSKSPAGYPQIRHKKKLLIASHVSYELYVGEIGEGLGALHHCDNPECTNPFHLFLGTHLDNMHDAVRKGRARGKKTYSQELIYAIRREFNSGVTQIELAQKYDIGNGYINRIVKNKARVREYANHLL